MTRAIKSPPSAQSPHLYDRTKALTDGVDMVALDMERKWGVGRLRLLVGVDLRERFDRQCRAWSEALWTRPIHEVEALASAMIRGWRALDAAAASAGATPLAPTVWETALGDGRVVAIVRDNAEAHAVARDGRYVEVWTLEEIGRVIQAFPDIGKAKEVFPGARIAAARVITLDWQVGDELPI